jgi:hypothetical protein
VANSSISYYWNSVPLVLLQLQELQKIEKPHHSRDTCVQIEVNSYFHTISAVFNKNNAASGGNIPTITSFKFIFTSFNVLTTVDAREPYQ